ncbi:MAG: rhodanese-like domain-containing protein [Cyanobacteria bacterium P01_F01_bin.4]
MQISYCQWFKHLSAPLLCLQLASCSGGWHKNLLTPKQSLGSSDLASPDAPSSWINPAINPTQTPDSLEHRWIVSGAEAKQLIEQGATLLDARGQGLIVRRLQGATAVSWQQFSPKQAAIRGTLLNDDEQLTQQLQALGISTQTPVVVFANPPNGWGEDGRIVWMLRTLGHRRAVMVDGGFQALVNAQVPLQQGVSTVPEAGDFVVRRTPDWDIQQAELRAQLRADNLVIIDTREPREFAGRTPYGEQRGGHVPGAINLYFKDFLNKEGTLLPHQTLLTKLSEVGITPDTQVVVYCTGGIRSGWLASVLATLGFSVKNYAGSMWEWSAAPDPEYPLETQ